MAKIASHSRDEMLSGYSDRRPLLDSLRQVTAPLLDRICPSNYVVAHSCRIKTFDSFFEKANKIKGGSLKYRDPLSDIDDLIGFRVIVVARRNVSQICSIIRSSLNVLSEENKSEQLLAEGKLGYESHHLIATLGSAREGLTEYKGLCNQKFEIQVRTALQHAWAENEHRVQYKTSNKNPELVKRFLRLAGIVSSADEEFDRIYELNEEIRNEVTVALDSLDQADDVLTPDDVYKNAKGHDESLREIAMMFGAPVSQLLVRGRYSEAVQVYDRFIAIQSKQVTHYAGRARALALMGEVDLARADLEIANKLAPGHPAINNTLKILDRVATHFDDGNGELE